MIIIKHKNKRPLGWVGLLLLCLMVFVPMSSQAGGDVVDTIKQQQQDRTIVLTVGKAETFEISGAVADILVANPSVVEVGALQSNRLYFVGNAVGDTNVLAFDDAGNTVARLNVHVRVDNTTLEGAIQDLFPGEDVRVKTMNDDIVLAGRVKSPAVATQIRELAGRFASADETIVNMLTVDGEQQVMLRVRVVEAEREVLNELGVETNLTQNSSGGSVLGSIATAAATGLTQNPFAIGSLLYNSGGFGPLEVIMRALERDGLISTLAEPNLTAVSGEQAGFLAGGEFPVPVGRDRDGNIIIEFRSFGVSLNFKPIVMSHDRINLQLSTEVSVLSNQNGLTLQGIEIPGLSVRRAETTVELNSGGSLMIAGLLQSDATSQLNNLPGAKNTPIIGDLMRSESFQRNESELVIMVTAYAVKPFADKTMANVKPSARNIGTPLPKRKPGENTTLGMVLDRNLRQAYGDDAVGEIRGAGYILNE